MTNTSIDAIFEKAKGWLDAYKFATEFWGFLYVFWKFLWKLKWCIRLKAATLKYFFHELDTEVKSNSNFGSSAAFS